MAPGSKGTKGPKFVVLLEAAAAMAEQAKALFKVEEQLQVGPGAVFAPLVIPWCGLQIRCRASHIFSTSPSSNEHH